MKVIVKTRVEANIEVIMSGENPQDRSKEIFSQVEQLLGKLLQDKEYIGDGVSLSIKMEPHPEMTAMF